MKNGETIGPLIPWCCTHFIDGVAYGIVLYATNPDQIERDWGIRVDGRLVGIYPT